MGKERKLVTIVNKNYPPGPGITGESANELAGWLLQNGVTVNIVHSDGKYDGGAATTTPNGKTFLVKSLYDGKRKFIRLFSSFVEGFLLIRRAKKIGSKGLIVVMTDPPFLILWASLLLEKNKWAYWSMDLYPEAFAAGKLVSERGFLYKQFKRILRKNPPNYIIALGEFQLQHILKGYGREIKAAILPCGVSKSLSAETEPDWKKTDRILLGYCGNIGEAHSADFLVELINSFDDQKFSLLVSVYGAKASIVKDAAIKRQGVIVKDRLQRSELSFIDIHLVSLLPEWNNVCVPSKAVSAVCEGGTIIFCGNTENDNWRYLKDAGWLVEFSPSLSANIQQVLLGISNDVIDRKKKAAEAVSQTMHGLKEKAFWDIYTFASDVA